MKTATDFLASAIRILEQHKELADKAIAQVNDDELFWSPNAASNSIYLIMKHVSGNMLSRWTDFLSSDGEKPWRDRDDEFEYDQATRQQALERWSKGWNCLFDALRPLKQSDLSRVVPIRGEPHSVMEAVNRQLAHYCYHIGQIVFVAKMLKGDAWQSLSIPKGKSREFNQRMPLP